MDEGVLMLKKKPVKLALRFLLCGKALDDADTGEVLVDIRRNIGRFFSGTSAISCVRRSE